VALQQKLKILYRKKRLHPQSKTCGFAGQEAWIPPPVEKKLTNKNGNST
jgi:hypothetical protein